MSADDKARAEYAVTGAWHVAATAMLGWLNLRSDFVDELPVSVDEVRAMKKISEGISEVHEHRKDSLDRLGIDI